MPNPLNMKTEHAADNPAGYCPQHLSRRAADRKREATEHAADKCDVRNCVNPSHLFVGTHADNNHDMIAKGRAVNLNGEAHALSRLTEKQVVEIRNRAFRGNYSALGREFGVSVQHIHRIVTGQRWKHIAKVKEGKV